MRDNRFAPAGWMAIAGAILTLPLMGTGFALDIVSKRIGAVHPLFPILYVGFGMLQAALVIYAFYRFKVFLNERQQFYRTDALIIIIIAGAITITTIGLTGKFFSSLGAPTPVLLGFIAALVVVGVPLGILTVIFGIRLLELGDDLNGLLKPYAFLTIVAGVCFATFVLSPLGLIVDAASNVALGMILLGKGTNTAPEFV